MKYKKKPVVVEAVQFTHESKNQVFNWASEINMNVYPTYIEGLPVIMIPNQEGELVLSFGDWLIKGLNNELYPCAPDIFEKTYEECKED
jgi:hypothetical protein